MAGIRDARRRRPARSEPLGDRGVRRRDARGAADPRAHAVELVTANSQVVRALVADGRADLGVAASRPGHTPNPGVRETRADRRRDRLRGPARPSVGASAPPSPPTASSSTPMVVRDPSSNARWTVDAVLAAAGLAPTAPLAEAATPRAAIAEARAQRAPVLLSRHIVAQTDFIAGRGRGPRLPAQLRAGPARVRRAGRGRPRARGPDPRARADLAALTLRAGRG